MGSNVVQIGVDDLPVALDLGEQRVREAVRYGAQAAAHRGRAMMVRATPADQGQLRASWKVKEGVSEELGSVQATLATLVNDAPHVGIVELGARPHKVSAEGWAAIYEWVRRHYRSSGGMGGSRRFVLGGPGRMKGRGQGSDVGPFRGSDPEITAITWAIVNKIKKHGQKATLFIRNMIPELRDVMGEELNRAIARAQRDIGSNPRRPT